MDIYQLSALMAEQRRAERLIRAERRRAAQVASCQPSRRPAPAGSHREVRGPRVRALHWLGHTLRSRSLPVPGDLR